MILMFGTYLVFGMNEMLFPGSRMKKIRNGIPFACGAQFWITQMNESSKLSQNSLMRRCFISHVTSVAASSFQKRCFSLNPLRTSSDLSQTSHCNIKGLSVSEVMRIENMITQVKFY